MEKTSTIEQGQLLVRTFYRFVSIEPERLEALQKRLTESGKKHNILGSLLLSDEGCNATICGAPDQVEEFFSELQEIFPGLTGQDSYTQVAPFQRWKVPLKKQIVQARDPELKPSANHQGQLTPKEWDGIRDIVRQGAAQMIDVRNDYEVGIGTFPEAINPETNTFKEFSDYLDREVGSSLDPTVPTAIFCTGGIRCEKARMDLERRGFQDVRQLKGGILGYFKQSEEQGFEGECFVFDDRVAVDANLEPTQTFELCPRCGGPMPKDSREHDCNNGRRVP